MAWRLALVIDPVDAGDHRASFADTYRAVDPDGPVLPIGDLGVQRLDGVFETLGVEEGRPRKVEAHLARLADSAALAALPAPHAGQWRAAIERAAQGAGAGACAMRLVYSRGVEATGPSGWVTVADAPPFEAVRTDGIRVITLDRGIDRRAAARAPWLLLGAKTLSYGTNLAAVSEARRRGADDALFVSSDGFVLEGTTSSVVVRFGDRFVTPTPSEGILPGTTQLALFAELEARGFVTTTASIPVAELGRADAAWLVSSVRMAAPIARLDDRSLAVDRGLTADLNAALAGVR
jgi:4-amino-4-deoxychorismate lyase